MRALAMLLVLVLPGDEAQEISVRVENDETLCTVKARGASVDAVLRELGRQSGREVLGLDSRWVFDPIDVDLVDRPLDLTVDGLAGAAGLRAQVKAGSITVRPDLDESASIEQLEDMAEVMFVRALRRFPESPDAAEAEMRLGQIQESRKHDEAARAHYDGIVRAHPDSPLVSEALLRAAMIHQRHAEWVEAAARWSQLANRPPPNPYAVKARVELTRCLAFQGDGRQALALIEALDRTMPPDNQPDRADRMYVRAAALVAADRGAEALAMLDEAMAVGLDQASSIDAIRLRAEAFDRAGMPAEAARSWLAYADKGGDGRRRTACARAARSAAKAGDSLGVLFVERLAQGSGAEDEILPLADAARETLGFTLKQEDMRLARLKLAEDQCSRKEFEEASRTLATIWRERADFGEPDFTRATLAHARCMSATVSLETAIVELRAALEDIRYPENRRHVYLLAGELYEQHEQWELAAQAYGGQL